MRKQAPMIGALTGERLGQEINYRQIDMYSQYSLAGFLLNKFLRV
jgi:hypothetical protein